MTDADRLRAAADLLDKANLVRWVTVPMADGHPSVTTEEVPQVQALLRAVADEHPEWAEGRYLASLPTYTAALALADVILGDTNG